MPFTTRLLAAGIAGAVLAAPAGVPASADPAPTGVAAPASASDSTSTAEKTRVDSVKTPKLGWYRCYDTAECATVKLPLDYDDPRGATTEVAVLRVRATNQKARIGSLFVNPGGPGGSGTSLALAAPYFLSPSVLAHFDIIGVDPRGTASSDNLKCFRSTKDQTRAYTGFNVAFPIGRQQEQAYIASARAIAKGCSTTGKALAGAMSTAEVARDMDVLRRAVGDEKLSYLGFSYGTALGQYYANMFPDRVRAIVVDGVINPISWAGTPDTADQILDERLRSADGAYRALREILRRCDKAGPKYCAFSAGNPTRNFATIADRLRAKPLVITDPDGTFTITYADFVNASLGALYDPAGASQLTAIAAELWDLMHHPGTAVAARAQDSLVRRITDGRRDAPRRDFPYENDFEAFSGVICTDGLHPPHAADWPALTAAADRRAPYFGRAWAWGTAQCAQGSWKAHDEDAYTGPFNRRTAAPVLFVGSLWDPATNYRQAVSSSQLLPNSRLLSSDNWGHTAYGTSPCATKAIDAYLLDGTLPAKGKTCHDAPQPFTDPLDEENPGTGRVEPSKTELATRTPPAADAPRQLPPVAVRIPASVLTGTR